MHSEKPKLTQVIMASTLSWLIGVLLLVGIVPMLIHFWKEGVPFTFPMLVPLFAAFGYFFAGKALKKYRQRGGFVALSTTAMLIAFHLILQAKISLVGMILMVILVVLVLMNWGKLEKDQA